MIFGGFWSFLGSFPRFFWGYFGRFGVLSRDILDFKNNFGGLWGYLVILGQLE